MLNILVETQIFKSSNSLCFLANPLPFLLSLFICPVFNSFELCFFFFSNSYQYNLIYRQMIIFQKFKLFLKHIDFFSSPILLRYNKKSTYSTSTSCALSIIFIGSIIYALSSSTISMLSRQNISVLQYMQIEDDPSLVELSTENFFIAIGNPDGIVKDEKKIFDYQFAQQEYINGKLDKKREIRLIECDKSYFEEKYANFSGVYERMHLKQFLCFPFNTTLSISGKQSNGNFSSLSFRLKRCKNNCNHLSIIQDFQTNHSQKFIDCYFINKLINPNHPQPINLYFEDKLFTYFGSSTLKKTNLYISEYEMRTDSSFIPPFENIQVSQGIFIRREYRQQMVLPVINDTYIQINIYKSDEKVHLSRTYDQTDDLLSYIGGIFSIFGLLIRCLISKYNKYSLEIEMSNVIFKPTERADMITDHQIENRLNRSKNNNHQMVFSKDFNYLTFIRYLVSQMICYCRGCMTMYKIEEQMVETQYKINCNILLEKLLLYEKNLKCFLSPHQFSLLLLQEKSIPSQLKGKRESQIERDQNFYYNINQIFRHALQIENNITEVGINSSKAVSGKSQDKVFLAIRDLMNQSSNGDFTSKNILEGLCKQILDEYQDSEVKQKSFNMTKKKQLVKINNISTIKDIFSQPNLENHFSYRVISQNA